VGENKYRVVVDQKNIYYRVFEYIFFCFLVINMFSFCKRNKGISYDSTNKELFDYNINSLNSEKGFGKKPLLCNGLTQPFVQNRQFPSDMIDLNTYIRGQNSAEQHCSFDTQEIQFSTFRDQYQVPRGPPPQTTISTYGNSECNNLWKGVNPIRPVAGMADPVTCELYNNKLKF
jgi:hypothetical protein